MEDLFCARQVDCLTVGIWETYGNFGKEIASHENSIVKLT